jgi:hypothetical protein
MYLKNIALAATLSFALGALPVTPRITGITPTSPTAGPAVQQLSVIGEGFMRGLSLSVTTPSGTVQTYKNVDVQSQEEASFRVGVTLTAPGAYTFVVTNTDGGVSQPFRLDATGPAPAANAPVIDGITPAKAAKQGQSQTLHVQGKRFVQGLVLRLSDPAGNVLDISGGSITNQTQNAFDATVTLTAEGEYTITVTNPDGQTSNAMNLSVRHY